MTPLDLTKAPPRSPRDKLNGLCMLPRMIDIARAMLPGGNVGVYQIGRGVSVPVLAAFGITASEFVDIVLDATGDTDVAEQLWPRTKSSVRLLDKRLRSITVADVPAELLPEFHRLYGEDLPPNRLFFDILDADDANKFRTEA